MSHEIEDYLKSIDRQLHVGWVRRHAIMSELRDHLSERLAELAEQGYDESEAIGLAIGEFGDPARLSAEFVDLSRELRRRWMMRFTAATFAAALTALMIGLSLWPDGSGPSTSRATAQDTGAAGGGQDPSVDQNNDITDHKLGERIEAQFMETPLDEVIDYVAEVADLQVYINRAALDELGVAVDTPITLDLKRVRVDMLLELALSQIGDLAYVVRDGIVMISAKSSLENDTEVKVYNSRDLLALGVSAAAAGMGGGFSDMGAGGFEGLGAGGEDYGSGFPGAGDDYGSDEEGGGYPGAAGGFGEEGYPGGGASGMVGRGHYRPTVASTRQAAQLIAIIEQTIETESWASTGGYGTIAEFGGLLVVNHNVRVQQRIAELLKMLREATEK